ncbi:MAG: hypothetical protein ACLTX6_03730 [Lachnospiraceae bacterium]
MGTGPGFFAILLAEAGYQVTAIRLYRRNAKRSTAECRWTGEVYCVENR